MTLQRGDQVSIRMTKWGERPHWVYPGRYLGSDQFGHWIGFRVGTHFERPGREYTADYDQVALIAPEDAGERGWVACMHGPESVKTRYYVDISTPPTFDGTDFHAIDLDLDVVQRVTGLTFVDDEDEFAEHQVNYGYPAEVVSNAEASCARVHEAVSTGQAPFDGATHLPWLEVLATLR